MRIKQRNDRVIEFEVVDKDGATINITDAQNLIYKVGDGLIEKDLSDGIEITDAPNGKVEVTLTAEDTDLPNRVYESELMLVDVEGARYTIFKEPFVVARSIIEEGSG